MKRLFLLVALFLASPALAQPAGYHQRTGHPDAWSGGVRMINISTPSGRYRVWTKRVGSNPRLRVLLLHGGPAATHEYFEAFDSYSPARASNIIITISSAPPIATSPMTTDCGRSTASSTRSSRSAARSA